MRGFPKVIPALVVLVSFLALCAPAQADLRQKDPVPLGSEVGFSPPVSLSRSDRLMLQPTSGAVVTVYVSMQSNWLNSTEQSMIMQTLQSMYSFASTLINFTTVQPTSGSYHSINVYPGTDQYTTDGTDYGEAYSTRATIWAGEYTQNSARSSWFTNSTARVNGIGTTIAHELDHILRGGGHSGDPGDINCDGKKVPASSRAAGGRTFTEADKQQKIRNILRGATYNPYDAKDMAMSYNVMPVFGGLPTGIEDPELIPENTWVSIWVELNAPPGEFEVGFMTNEGFWSFSDGLLPLGSFTTAVPPGVRLDIALYQVATGLTYPISSYGQVHEDPATLIPPDRSISPVVTDPYFYGATLQWNVPGFGVVGGSLNTNPDEGGVKIFPFQAGSDLLINEIRTDMTSTDTDEYFELKGTPLTDLSDYTYIVIGDGTGACGVVECVVPLTGYSIQADGFFAAAKYYAGGHVLTGYDADINSAAYAFENTDNVTHLLVSGWTGTIASDLDTNDDGTLDVTPWTAIIDGVALVNAAVVTCAGVEYTYYPSATLGPDGTFHPGHVYRCSDTGAWVIGQFTINVDDSPGATNPTCANPPPEFLSEPRTPCVPFVAQPATVQAVVLNATAADIHYKVNGGLETTVAMAVVATSGDTTTFEYVLPGQAGNGDLVEYYVTAYNANPDMTQGYNQGYFVGTKSIRSLYVNDVNGANIYRYYGARVTGNVTLPYGVIQVLNTDYNIQDATGGINVFKYGTHTVQPGLGDDVTVEGIIDQYNGKLEIASNSTCDTLLVEINGPGAVPAAKLATTCSDLEAIENDLVRMMLVKFPAGTDTLRANTNYLVTNCYADTIILRVDGDTNIPGTPVTSLYANAIGIASQFDSASPFTAGYQLIPRFASDIEFVATTGIEDRTVRPIAQLLQNAPNPFGRSTEIRYQVPAGAKAGDMVPVTIKVFDIRGRLVKTLVEGLQTPGDHVISLTGGALSNAGSGIYFYRLETGGQVLTRRLVYLAH